MPLSGLILDTNSILSFWQSNDSCDNANASGMEHY
jgi:hypothetical protein